jgi:hypothetical protein
MVSDRQLRAMRLYCDLMEEVKIRLACIDAATMGSTGLPGPIVRELCFLQLRMICELIALGCLVAHGDIKAAHSGKFQKEYSAQNILENLGKLHPDFYPFPVIVKRMPDGNFEMEHDSTQHFSKEELLGFYGKSGASLHRGSLKKLLKPQMPVETHFRSITSIADKIRKLLGMHTHYLFDRSQFICQLSNPNDRGRTTVISTTPMQPGRGPGG